MICSLVLQLWSIVNEFVQDLLMSQKVLIELLVGALEVMTLLNLVVDRHIIVLIVEHLESDWVAQASKFNILMVRSTPLVDLRRVPKCSMRLNLCPLALVHSYGG